MKWSELWLNIFRWLMLIGQSKMRHDIKCWWFIRFYFYYMTSVFFLFLSFYNPVIFQTRNIHSLIFSSRVHRIKSLFDFSKRLKTKHGKFFSWTCSIDSISTSNWKSNWWKSTHWRLGYDYENLWSCCITWRKVFSILSF